MGFKTAVVVGNRNWKVCEELDPVTQRDLRSTRAGHVAKVPPHKVADMKRQAPLSPDILLHIAFFEIRSPSTKHTLISTCAYSTNGVGLHQTASGRALDRSDA